MKILFLCGSLEPGRDGVGDFTRRLAGELIKQGHKVAAVALNDTFVSNLSDSIQEIDSVVLSVFRVPSVMTKKVQLSKVKEWIEEFNPLWLSLQYVPFSYHPKGLPIGLTKMLSNIGEGRRWHIMFHELWVGMNVKASIKSILWGLLQKQLIKSLVLNLDPYVIQTQSRLYQAQLSKLGFYAEYLPLFSNIPCVSLAQDCSPDHNGNLNNFDEISLVIFGGIHSGAPVKEFAKEASCFAWKSGIKISLTIIGRCGNEQNYWAEVFRSEGMAVQILGELPPDSISNVLKNASIGVTTTPLALVEKSGSVMAMREHGLSVICVSIPWKPKGGLVIEPPLGIQEYNKGNFEICLSAKGFKNPFLNSLSQVSYQLTKTLSAIV